MYIVLVLENLRKLQNVSSIFFLLILVTKINSELLNKYECIFFSMYDFETRTLEIHTRVPLHIQKKVFKLVDLYLASSGSYMSEFM